MPRVKIYVKCLNQQEKNDLLGLLRAAGHEAILDEDHEVIGIAPEAEVPDEDVLIVLINAACEADPDLDRALMQAAGTNCRVIGIWPEGETTGKVPAALDRYGWDIVTWNPKKLREAIEEAPAQWETVEGAPRAEPPTKRNRC
jgi:hypothetical protein